MYASDTANPEWAVIEPHRRPSMACGGGTILRKMVNAIFYFGRTAPLASSLTGGRQSRGPSGL
jgi:transposase